MAYRVFPTQRSGTEQGDDRPRSFGQRRQPTHRRATRTWAAATVKSAALIVGAAILAYLVKTVVW